MLKKLISIVVLLLMNMSFFTNIGVAIWFQVQKEKIVSDMCIQKNREVNTCRGCCVLNEHLSQTQYPDTGQPVEMVQMEWLVFVIPSSSDLINPFEPFKNQISLINKLLSGTTSDTFHPPQCNA